MGSLPETQGVLTEMVANRQFGWGEHTYNNIAVGSMGIQVGTEAYDPTRHFPWQINPLAPLGLAMGEHHVNLVLPSRPMAANVIVDHSLRRDHSSVTAAKRYLGDSLLSALDESLPGMSDQIYSYVIGESGDAPSGYELIEATDGLAVVNTVTAIARDGLTFVISDFRRLELGGRYVDNLVAIKANHPAERSIPAGAGLLSLGRGREINTNDSTQLGFMNDRLQAEHEQIVRTLRAAGAAVAEVIVKPSAANGYDFTVADHSIAKALAEKA